MTIPAGSIRIVLVGHLTGGEIFNTGFWASNNATNGPLDTEAEANTLAGDVVTLFTSSGLKTACVGFLDSGSGYDAVKVYSYPDGGPTAGVVGSANITSGAGVATAYQPLQACWVASLRTAYSGRARRGRMYFPAVSATLASNHQLGSTGMNDWTDKVAAFLTAVNANSRIGSVIVLSQLGAGSAADVTHVIGDSRLDIQRRRADKQTAAFVRDAVVS